MPRLFSYGSLRQPAVQVATFGRELSGREDELVGFELATLQRTGKLLVNAVYNGRGDSRVPGMVFEVTEAEVLAADAYERTDDYVRIPAPLASRADAWVYVDAASSNRPGPPQ
jgi:gamma-glutamylcyclotransferase (GGCT)/AIG2-like uncharacterized protein YtfP